jgi:hypothetical protein
MGRVVTYLERPFKIHLAAVSGSRSPDQAQLGWPNGSWAMMRGMMSAFQRAGEVGATRLRLF